MNKIWLALIITILFLQACSEDEPVEGAVTLSLNLKSQFGTEQFVLNNFYPYDNGDEISFSNLRFYISDVKLLKSNGDVAIHEIGNFDFKINHSEASTAINGETVTIQNVTPGEYMGIAFGIGVAPLLNKTLPTDYDAGHPLSEVSNYWTWRETFIFSTIEGQIRKASDTEDQVFYVYHSGTDALYQTQTFNQPLNFAENETVQLNFELDAKKIFINGTGTLDIRNNNSSHSGPDDIHIAEQVITNLGNAIILNE